MLTKKNRRSESGYSLIEVMCALTILGVVFAYAAPMYMYCRLKIETAQRRTEASIVAQNIITTYSSQKIANLPLGGSPININDPNLLKVAGRNYTGKITFCPLPAIEKSPDTGGCAGNRPDFREAGITISHNGIVILSLQTAFADLK